jgi:ABC-type dipeptide/oligopeptide/nickel transport system permease component
VASYLVRRLAMLLVTMFAIIFVNFLILHALPINYAKVIAGTNHASPVTIAEITRNYGLNLPIVAQFGLYLGQLAHLDLGYSYQFHLPVAQMLAQAVPHSIYLGVAAIVLEVAIGVPLGVFFARRAGTWADTAFVVLSLVSVSVPTFAVGSIFLYVFAYRLGWFPLGGSAPFPDIRYVVLPALSYALTSAAYDARLVRQSLIEVAGEDYVRTARAKGLSEAGVTWRHMMRNALIPLVTYLGLDFAYLLGGLLVVETIFDWPGLGAMTSSAIRVIDVPTILGVVLFASAAIVVMNLVVDVVYALLDPRITYS